MTDTHGPGRNDAETKAYSRANPDVSVCAAPDCIRYGQHPHGAQCIGCGCQLSGLLAPEHLHNRGSNPWPDRSGGRIVDINFSPTGLGAIDLGSTPGIPPGGFAGMFNITLPGIDPHRIPSILDRVVRERRRQER
jgi:hypothetical protein